MTGARAPSTPDLAAAAAQAVRELNHRTQKRSALTGPAQLDRIVTELADLAAGLPQLLGQLDDWLATELHAGRIRSDNHADPGRIVDQATADLADAGPAARQLGQILQAAHRHTAHLGIRSTDDRSTTGRPTPPTGQESWPPVGTFVATSGQDPWPPVGRSKCPLTHPDGQLPSQELRDVGDRGHRNTVSHPPDRCVPPASGGRARSRRRAGA